MEGNRIETFCICLDCDKTSTMNKHGSCNTCGSKSTLKQGAIKALKDKLKFMEIQELLTASNLDLVEKLSE